MYKYLMHHRASYTTYFYLLTQFVRHTSYTSRQYRHIAYYVFRLSFLLRRGTYPQGGQTQTSRSTYSGRPWNFYGSGNNYDDNDRGATAPIVIPFFGYKLYKIHSHKKKRCAVQDELAARNVSPQKEKIRDVLPFVTGMVTPVLTFGISHGIGI
jgi:hypothetical protein